MRLFILAVLAATTLVAAPADAGQPRPPSDPAGTLLAALDTHSIIAKSSPDVGPFVFDLIRDPRFPGRGNDIAVECGDSRLHPLLGAYIGRAGRTPAPPPIGGRHPRRRGGAGTPRGRAQPPPAELRILDVLQTVFRFGAPGQHDPAAAPKDPRAGGRPADRLEPYPGAGGHGAV